MNAPQQAGQQRADGGNAAPAAAATAAAAAAAAAAATTAAAERDQEAQLDGDEHDEGDSDEQQMCVVLAPLSGLGLKPPNRAAASSRCAPRTVAEVF